MRHLLFVGATFLLAASQLFAQDASKSFPLQNIKWAGPPVTMENLKGKTVGVLVYATWCPKCNVWSGELFSQLKQSVQGKPAVILAINTDDSPEDAQKYITERGFLAPNILHGYDPSLPAKLGFESNLFQYVTIDSEGTPMGKGYAGVFMGDPTAKKFSLATALAQPQIPGKFKLMTEGLPEPVSAILWPLELGQANDAAVLRARNTLNAEQKKQLDQSIEAFLEAGLQEVKEGYKGSIEQQFVAYEKAAQLASVFKTAPQNKTAREVMQFMESNESFKKELAAKKAYDAVMQKPPVARKNLLKGLAQRFEGTEYGKKAANQ